MPFIVWVLLLAQTNTEGSSKFRGQVSAYLPPQKLKNIPERIRIFLVEPAGGEPASRALRRHRLLAIKVVVVVLVLLVVGWLAYHYYASQP